MWNAQSPRLLFFPSSFILVMYVYYKRSAGRRTEVGFGASLNICLTNVWPKSDLQLSWQHRRASSISLTQLRTADEAIRQIRQKYKSVKLKVNFPYT